MRLSLTQQVMLLSLVPIVVLGFVLTRVLEQQIVSRSLSEASQSARLIANIGIEPRLTLLEMSAGLSRRQIAQLDEQLRSRSATENLARVKIWNAQHKIIYSDDHRLIGTQQKLDDDLDKALAGGVTDASVVTPRAGSETDSEVGLGRLVEVYVPLRFPRTLHSSGAFEIYLSYAPIAEAVSDDERTIAIVVAVGLTLLWAILYRIVAQASRRLRRQSRENYMLARFDPLTGLPNRTMFRERVRKMLARTRDLRQVPAVLLIDLDGFKDINNTLGNVTGDRILRETASRFQRELGEEALVARFGGDEYAILCPRADGVSGALATAANLQSSLESPTEVGDVALNLEASIGIAVLEGAQETLDELLERANTALARAKSRHSRVEVYNPEYDSFDPARLALLGQVRLALERGEFELHYQPKMELRTRRVSGVEALLRWRHPERGVLMPMEFIPLVEQTALIGPLTLHAIDQALSQVMRWREHGLDLDIALNLSARNLLDLDLPGQVAASLHRHHVTADHLTVEVTESATLADPDRAVEVLRALRASGVEVSIDDFGTGNASIAYLTTLPANEIKIDRSLVTDICEDPRADAIARSIVELARNLELRVVAEGIETTAVMERFAELGCDLAQGYLISRPLPAEELTVWLTRSTQPARERATAPRRSSVR